MNSEREVRAGRDLVPAPKLTETLGAREVRLGSDQAPAHKSIAATSSVSAYGSFAATRPEENEQERGSLQREKEAPRHEHTLFGTSEKPPVNLRGASNKKRSVSNWIDS